MWRARPVFISSTFQDMQAERDFLRTRVFPELEERLRARRHHLEWVDLRVGIAAASDADEAGRELQVLRVCLDEVERCKPFFIVLLGDRYGWVPPAERARRATAEVGFTADPAGRSVTDLEIELGILANPDQRHRSFFYFRDPLPYAEMPAHLASLYADTGDYADRLAALKQRIETMLPARVRRYRAGWDAARQRVTDLDEWGRMVLEDIWVELIEETADPDEGLELSWQEAEYRALADFVADRARDFVGREALLSQLMQLAQAPADAADAWGCCITGTTGSGKSALFGQLDMQLLSSEVYLLAHAAGASPRSASVDAMLRRWIHQLAGSLSVDPGLDENAEPERVEQTFASLLSRMAQQRRVVVLVDALDQFEATNRGRYLTWLPQLWPENARFIATAIPGDASQSLSERVGIEETFLPSLTAAEARAIVAGICGRYHRVFEPEVIEAVLQKAGPEGPAWAHPLWLVLAVEELNLLDEDDFTRVQRAYSGAPAERLRALMVDTVVGLPGDVPGVYEVTFRRAIALFGAPLALGFLGIVATGRAGWREADFRAVLPTLSAKPWDELRFAQLRRLFRGQMRQRGALAQWDFNHAQMRLAAKAHLVTEEVPEIRLHAALAGHLLSLSPEDPLRQTETMVHLLGSEDWIGAARYYGNQELTREEVAGAARAIAQMLLTGTNEGPLVIARSLGRIAYANEVSESVRGVIADRFLHELANAVRQHSTVQARLTILELAAELFRRVLRSVPPTPVLLRNLSLSLSEIGDVYKAQGKLTDAIQAYRAGFSIVDGFNIAEPSADTVSGLGWLRRAASGLRGNRDSAELDTARAQFGAIFDRDRVHSLLSIGKVQAMQGMLAEALDCYHEALSSAERLARAHPEFPDTQSNVYACLTSIGEVFVAQGRLTDALESFRKGLAIIERADRADPEKERGLAVCHDKIGEVLLAQGKVERAFEAFRKELAICERLTSSDPSNAQWQQDFSTSLIKMGDALETQGVLPEALKYFRRALAIRDRLARSDPGNLDWQRSLSISLERVGDILRSQDDLGGAMEVFQNQIQIANRLARVDPSNTGRQRDLAAAYERVGTVLELQGYLEEALDRYRLELAIMEPLATKEPGNTDWQRFITVVYRHIARALKTQGRLSEALGAYRASYAIAERLVRKDPSNKLWQYDLSMASDRIRELLQSQIHH